MKRPVTLVLEELLTFEFAQVFKFLGFFPCVE